jgi:hypothetical protein
VRTDQLARVGAATLVALFALIGVAACGGGEDPAPDTATRETGDTKSRREARAPWSRGALRDVRFAVKPIVEVEVCRSRDWRKCFPVTYTAYARLTRKIPGRGSDIASVEFYVGGGLPIDPIGRLRRPRSCFSQSLYTNSPALAGIPYRVGARITLTFEAFNAQGDRIGSLATNVRLSKPEPPRRGDDISPPASEAAVGC